MALDVIYVGNHGLEIEGAGISFVHPDAAAARGAIDQACWDLEAAFEGVPAVTVERKDLSATVHYRQAPADLTSWIQATVNATVRPYLSKIFVGPALEACEIRPQAALEQGIRRAVFAGEDRRGQSGARMRGRRCHRRRYVRHSAMGDLDQGRVPAEYESAVLRARSAGTVGIFNCAGAGEQDGGADYTESCSYRVFNCSGRTA